MKLTDHPLWQGSMPMLTSTWMNKDAWVKETQKYIQKKESCDDLTTREKTFIQLLKAEIQE